MGSKQIRNRGTIGGNLANASPAGDMLPPLTALDARVVTVNSKNEIKRRTVNDIVAPGSPQKLKFDEAVVSIELPAPRGESVNTFAKLGSRRAVSIARLSVALNAGFSGGLLTAPIVILGALGRAPVDAKRAAAAIRASRLRTKLRSASPKRWRKRDLAIPGRYSQPYKREAIKGLALDLLSQLPR
ncbi:MAG: FAD binding domain-containing protein [Cloacibacillus evryensis]